MAKTEKRKMKDSCIEWIGEVPIEWTICKSKHIFDCNKKIVGNKSDNYERLSLTLKGVLKRDKEDNEGLQPDNFDTYQIVDRNSLIFKLIDLQNISTSRVGLSNYEGIVSPAYIVLRPKTSINVKYAEYYYLSMWMNQVFNTLGDAGVRSSINSNELLNLHIVIPSIEEQKRVADFLGDKCSKIDRIVSDINKQIENLENYKKTLISDLATGKKVIVGAKLCEPKKIKDSGIQWIGKIPFDWEMEKGKYIFKYIFKEAYNSDEVITCFRNGEVTLRSNRRVDGFTISEKEIGYQGIDVGDLIVHGMDGFAGSIGISDSRGKATPVLNNLDTNQNKRFYMYLLRSYAYLGVFESLSTGIRVRTCDTNWGKLKDISYLLPPVEEQNIIANYLDDKCFKINLTIYDKNNQIETLEKYKKSLIYEYVTGKKQV